MPWFKKSPPAQPAAPAFQFQPYLKGARYFSSWFRIRVVMAVLLFLSVVELIVSGVQMESYSGKSPCSIIFAIFSIFISHFVSLI